MPFKTVYYLMVRNGVGDVGVFEVLLLKTDQNLSVSSPAPVTIFCPSGDIARYKTRKLCPVSVAICVILG
jgi:hypothetical protein